MKPIVSMVDVTICNAMETEIIVTTLSVIFSAKTI